MYFVSRLSLYFGSQQYRSRIPNVRRTGMMDRECRCILSHRDDVVSMVGEDLHPPMIQPIGR